MFTHPYHPINAAMPSENALLDKRRNSFGIYEWAVKRCEDTDAATPLTAHNLLKDEGHLLDFVKTRIDLQLDVACKVGSG